MKFINFVYLLSEHLKCRSFLSSFFIFMSLISCAYFIGSTWMEKDFLMISPRLVLNTQKHIKCEVENGLYQTEEVTHELKKCNDKCRPVGSESLPKSIVTTTSNLEMYPLSGPIPENNEQKNGTSLLAMAVGIKQKEVVNRIVNKFLEEEFVVMFFHYDGIVDEWNDMEWNDKVIHVSAINQTKWWFAKRFLHPDIVDEYQYIFLWDEDLGVEFFNPKRYISIIKEEGLEISQPALDLAKSKVHHQITVRNRRSRVHRRYYRPGRCDANSTGPPCVGWVEMMVPVFSRAAWRCAWYMIQNDLIHAWGLDKQLGYCAQGDRTTKVGVVDEEYVLHLGLPTLGGLPHKDKVRSDMDNITNRSAIRLRSYDEMRTFTNRWNNTVKDDQCWVDLDTPKRFGNRRTGTVRTGGQRFSEPLTGSGSEP